MGSNIACGDEEKCPSKQKHNHPHPLLVDLVLEDILNLLPVSTLREARLVCKKWNSIASEVLLPKTFLDLSLQKDKTIEELIESVDKGSCLPFENISISLAAATREDSDMLHKIHHGFIEPLSNSITSIHFQAWEDCFDGGALGLQFLNTVLLTPTHLTSLSLSTIPRSIALCPTMFEKPLLRDPALPYLDTLSIYGRAQFGRGFLEDFLMSMPNLKEVTFKHPTERTVSIFSKIMLKMRYDNLKDLKLFIDGIFQPYPINQQIGVLAAAGPLNLESLQMDMSGHAHVQEEHEEWQRRCCLLLCNMHKTLKSLRITHRFRNVLPREKVLEMPFLPQLKQLHLDNWTDLGSMHFLQNVPNLECLILQIKLEAHDYQMSLPPNFIADTGTLFYPEMPACKTLLRLQLPPYPLPTNILNKILNSFPNLRRLMVAATDAMLLSLYRLAPFLEELELDQKSQVTDFGMTGIHGLFDQELKDKALKSYKETDKSPAMFLADLITESRTLSIASLSNLKLLKIDGRFSWMTDMTAHFGFKFLKNLTSLTLTNCKMTTHSFEALKTLPLMHLDMTNSLPARFISEDLIRLANLKSSLPFLHLKYQQTFD